MPQFTKLSSISLFVFTIISFCFLSSCNTQDKSQESQSPQSDTPEIKAPPVSPPRVEDWHMYMNDLQFSGRSLDKKIQPALQLLWNFKTGGPIKASPVVVNDVVFIGSMDGKLYALDAKSWGIKWEFDAGSAIRFSAAVWDGRVYFSTRDNMLYSLNAETGDMLWEFKSKGWMDAPPVVFNGTVYTGAYPAKIYMLNAINGEVKSERNRTITINGIEYGCMNGVFRPVIPQHNESLWRGYTEGSDSFPVIANGFAYIGARNGKIHAINIASKSETWSHQVNGSVDAAPAISDGILYAASTDGSIYAFSNLTEVSSAVTDTRSHGIITRDNVPVYLKQDKTKLLYRLNDGTELPIVKTAADWYQVELPNKENVWLDKYGFGQFEDTEGVMFNTNFCGTPRLLHLIAGAENPYWSPNGKLVAMLKRTDLSGSYWKASELWIMDKDGKQTKKLYTGVFYNPHVSWSLDSRLIAFEVKEDDKRYIYTADWELTRINKFVRGKAPAWSPTANHLAFRRREKGNDYVFLINSDGSGGKNIARVPFKRPHYTYTFLHAPSWSTDGGRLAFDMVYDHKVGNSTVPYAAIRVQSVEGDLLEQIPTQHQYVRQLRWSPSGSQLAYVLSGGSRSDPVFDKRLHIAPIKDDSLKHKVLKHTTPAWAPAGNRLAFLEREDCDGLRWKVWVYDLDTGKKYAIARTSMKIASIVWMPDGKSLCIWHTSDYLRDNEYLPANTKGWIVPIKSTP